MEAEWLDGVTYWGDYLTIIEVDTLAERLRPAC
jgi:hypothetical protein